MNKESIKVAINSLYGLIVPIIVGLMGFWVTPYLLNKLSPEVYGIWVLIASIIGPIALLEFGMSEATSKYVAVTEEKKNTDQSNKFIESTIFFNIIISLSGFVIICLIGYFLPFFGFGISNQYIEIAQKSFFIAGLNFCIIRFIGVCEGVFKAIQDFKTISIVTTTGRILYSLAGVAAAYLSYGLVGVVLFQAFSYLFILILWIYILKTKTPQFSFWPNFHKEEFFLTFKYGSWNTVGRIASILMKNADKVLIGSFLSVSLVGFFNAAWLLSNFSFIIVLPFSGSLMPYFSILEERNNKRLLHDRLEYSTWLLSNLIILISIPFFIFSYEILYLWISPECALYMASPLRFLILANWISSLNIGLAQFILGVGLVRENTIWSLSRGFTSIIMTFFLIKYIGIKTAGLGSFLSQFSVIWLIFIVWKKRFIQDLNFSSFLRGFLQPLICGSLIVFILLIVKTIINQKVETFFPLILILIITGLISIILFIIFNLIFIRDKDKMIRTFDLLSNLILKITKNYNFDNKGIR